MRYSAWIVDCDNTLVDASPLKSVAAAGMVTQNFDEYHRQSMSLSPITWVVRDVQVAHRNGIAILIVTARQERYRKVTEAWLKQNNVPFDELVMRKNGDQRGDVEIKDDIYEELVLTYDIIKAYEDRQDVAKLWADKGVPVTLVTLPIPAPDDDSTSWLWYKPDSNRAGDHSYYSPIPAGWRQFHCEPCDTKWHDKPDPFKKIRCFSCGAMKVWRPSWSF